jgi:hypothetical protein
MVAELTNVPIYAITYVNNINIMEKKFLMKTGRWSGGGGDILNFCHFYLNFLKDVISCESMRIAGAGSV